MKTRNTRRFRWLRRVLLLAGAVTVVAAAAAGVALTATGVFDRRPGAWTVPLRAAERASGTASASAR